MTVQALANAVSTHIKLPPCSFRFPEISKGQIVRFHAGNDTIDLHAILEASSNVFFDYLRLEPHDDDHDDPGTLIFVSHMDRQSGVHFGYPFAICVPRDVSTRALKQLIAQKLNASEKAVARWRLCADRGRLVHLKEDEILTHPRDGLPVHVALEQTHPNPVLLGLSGKAHAGIHKPLTIR